jgi:hypothetical protein
VGEFGTGPEGGAKAGKQVDKEGEHDRVAHDVTGRMLPYGIPALTDGKTTSRMASWRTTGVVGYGCGDSPKVEDVELADDDPEVDGTQMLVRNTIWNSRS